MPLCHKTKQAFIHIPKCGGTTVEHRYNLLSKEQFFAEDPKAYVFDGIAYAPQQISPRHLSILILDFSILASQSHLIATPHNAPIVHQTAPTLSQETMNKAGQQEFILFPSCEL